MFYRGFSVIYFFNKDWVRYIFSFSKPGLDVKSGESSPGFCEILRCQIPSRTSAGNLNVKCPGNTLKYGFICGIIFKILSLKLQDGSWMKCKPSALRCHNWSYLSYLTALIFISPAEDFSMKVPAAAQELILHLLTLFSLTSSWYKGVYWNAQRFGFISNMSLC